MEFGLRSSADAGRIDPCQTSRTAMQMCVREARPHYYASPMQKSTRLVFSLVIFCFFISGMAGLIYQLAWMRYLALFLGHTSYAVVAVLVAFMGGLAIGNAAFGIWADKSTKPLALYGWL